MEQQLKVQGSVLKYKDNDIISQNFLKIISLVSLNPEIFAYTECFIICVYMFLGDI